MNKLNKMIIILLCMFITLSTQAQEEYNNPTMHGDGTKLLKANRDNSWDFSNLQWKPTDSLLHTYDAQGRVTQTVYRAFTLPNWNINRIRKISYTATGKDHIIIDSVPNAFSSCRKYTYTYNANGQKTLIDEYRLNASYNWFQAYRKQISYTATGKVNTELGEVYLSSVWKNDERSVSTYNAADQFISLTNETWNTTTSTWVPVGRRNWTYNVAGLLQTRIEQSYNTTTSAWVNYSKNDYTYNSNGKQLSDIWVEWNLGTNTWVNKYKYTNTYGTNNRLSTTTTEKGYGAGWQNYGKGYYSYINTDWCNLAKSTSWNVATSQYDTTTRTNFVYDTKGYITKYTFEGFNTSLNAWGNVYEKFFWYTVGPAWPTAIEDVELKKSFVAYPNPIVSNSFNISSEEEGNFIIYDMHGKLISRGTLIKGINIIPCDNVIKGTYILQVNKTSQLIVKD